MAMTARKRPAAELEAPKQPWWTEAYQYDSSLTDVTVIAGFDGNAREYELHKIILITQSTFFRACLNRGFRESTTSQVELPDIPADIFDIVVYWMYDRDTKLRYERGDYDDNTQGPGSRSFDTPHVISKAHFNTTMALIEAANFLGMSLLKEHIWDVIVNHQTTWGWPVRGDRERARLRALAKLYSYRTDTELTDQNVYDCYALLRKTSKFDDVVEGLKTLDANEDLGGDFLRWVAVALIE